MSESKEEVKVRVKKVKVKNPYTPNHIIKYVIERIRLGERPKHILRNIQKQFYYKLSLKSIDRFRYKHIEQTGEELKSYREFHRK